MSSNIERTLIDYHPNNLSDNFRCGNNYFSDNIWDFKGFVAAPHWHDAKFKIDFTPYSNWPDIQETLKHYIVSELLINTLNSVKRKFAAFKYLRDFIVTENLFTFQDLTKNNLEKYFKFLLAMKNERGKPLSPVSIKKAAQVIQELLKRGGKKGWNVPKKNIYVDYLYKHLIINNKKISNGTKFGSSNKVLPNENITSQLIKTAKNSLENKEDVLTAASILIASQLGLRISEVINLKKDCLSVIDGEYYITYMTSKTAKEPTYVTKPANKIIVTTINTLKEYTKALRDESGLQNLFLTRSYNIKGTPVCIASFSNWEKNRLNPYLKKKKIIDENSNTIKLTHHTFRHIFATYAFKSGMKAHNVQELMNHKSMMMTETYDHSKHEKQQVVKEILTGSKPLSSTNKVMLGRLEGEDSPFKGLTIDQVDKMRKALKIELLPHGLCLHHPMRGDPCEQDGACLGCSNFIVSTHHLPIHESRLHRLKKELDQQADESSIYTSKLRFQKEKEEYYVNDLKNKLNKISY